MLLDSATDDHAGRGRILQSAPNVAKLQEALNFFLESSGWFGRRPGVRMSLLVAADAKSAPGAVYLLGPVTRLDQAR